MRKNGIFYSFEGKEIDKKTFPFLEDRDTAIVQTGQGKKEVLTFSGIVLEKNKVFVSFPKHFKVLDKDKVAVQNYYEALARKSNALFHKNT